MLPRNVDSAELSEVDVFLEKNEIVTIEVSWWDGRSWSG